MLSSILMVIVFWVIIRLTLLFTLLVSMVGRILVNMFVQRNLRLVSLGVLLLLLVVRW